MKSALLAGVEDTPVDGLQAVAHIGQRAGDDHAHRVIEITRLHLINDVDGADIGGAGDGRFVVAQNQGFRCEFGRFRLTKSAENCEAKAGFIHNRKRHRRSHVRPFLPPDKAPAIAFRSFRIEAIAVRIEILERFGVLDTVFTDIARHQATRPFRLETVES